MINNQFFGQIMKISHLVSGHALFVGSVKINYYVFFKVSITLPHTLQVPPPTPPASANDMPESSSKKLSCPRRKRSMRRGTAEIQTTWLPDPEYQRDTVESTQGRLDREYNFLYNLVKVRERSSIQNINCLLSYVGGCMKMTDYYTEKDI